MCSSKFTNLAKITIFCVGLLASVVANSAVVFEDNFNQIGVTPVAVDFSTNTWATSRFSSALSVNAATGDGVLAISSASSSYAGVTTEPMADFDFFSNELTITFTGINFSQPAPGDISGFGVRLGVAGFITDTTNSWHLFSNFGVGFSDNGGFNIFGYQSDLESVQTPLQLQEVPVPYLNLNISQLTAIKLTLDDLNYRVVFEFGTPLNIMSFSGAHNLSRDLWHVSDAIRSLNALKITAEQDLDDATVSGIQADIDIAQASLDEATVNLDDQLITEAPASGMSSMFFTVVSEDRTLATVTVNSISVETTNTLQVLR